MTISDFCVRRTRKETAYGFFESCANSLFEIAGSINFNSLKRGKNLFAIKFRGEMDIILQNKENIFEMQVLIENLSPEFNRKLLGLGVKKTFSANQQIFAENEKATFLPVILQGSVKMVRFPASGKEVIIGVFRAGEIFAIPPALDGKPFPATAVAMEESELLLLPRPKFLDLLDESTEFSALVLSRMCGILRDRSKTVQILATPSAEQRVGAVLLQLIEDEPQNEQPFEIKLRRQDIAEMAGLTTETTIRAIGQLANKNLLKIIRRKIVVEDVAPLRNFLS